jgi:hypothetical protein
VKWAPAPPEAAGGAAAAWKAAMGRKTPEPVKQPKPKKTPDDKRLISFRIAHAVADPDAARPQPKEDGEDACVEDGEQAPPRASG